MIFGQCLRRIFSVSSMSSIWGERVLFNKTVTKLACSATNHPNLIICSCFGVYAAKNTRSVSLCLSNTVRDNYSLGSLCWRTPCWSALCSVSSNLPPASHSQATRDGNPAAGALQPVALCSVPFKLWRARLSITCKECSGSRWRRSPL